MAYIKTNIEGTYNVLEAARAYQTEQVVITSTSETYGSAQYVPIDENHPKVGQSPYSATKIAADQLAYSYFASFDLPVKIVRPLIHMDLDSPLEQLFQILSRKLYLIRR